MTHFDLAIIGSGSGNSIPDERFSEQRIAILEKGTFGGTCLNVGCIPTKMFVHPADLAASVAHARELGVDLTLEGVRWAEIRDRIFRRIDPISVAGRNYRAERLENVTLFEGHARFTGPRTIDTGTGETITADQVVLAAGSRAVVPDIPGLAEVDHHTSDTIMRIDALPERLAIIGGGFVAAEFAHVFGSFGTAVTILNRSDALLRGEDEEVSARFTALARERWDVRLDTTAEKVEEYGEGIRLHLDTDGVAGSLDVDMVLVATGRRSNSDGLALDLAGVEVDEDGLVVVDEHQRTTAEGVWALGDVSNRFQLKHVSNDEARVVRHNLLHVDRPEAMVTSNHEVVPSAVFTSPQVASVGLTEQDARERGLRYVTARQSFGDTAYGWAMEDTSGFAKVLADPDSGRLLGAHLMGPEASNLIQPLIGAMSFGQTAQEVARGQYWIHPALTEVVENLLLGVCDDAPRTGTPG
ncbi:MAG TPA: mycothione reductase [Nocardioidaceae bacterium]|nr:mycothione reductase [Nocardioidaceae bacterium]